MARKVKDVVISANGRDKNKMFRITEMPALKAERWALRALQALAASGVELPEGFSSMPLAQMANIGIRALANVPFDIAEPLLEEMMQCVEFVPNHKKPDFTLKLDIQEDTIEEISTSLLLRKETLMLHVGFFTAEEGQTSE